MKKILVLCVLLFAFSACGDTREKLFIINWGEYMDPDLIVKFEDEYNVNIIYEEVDSNESMYSRIKIHISDYDLAIPSDYMVQKMINENMLKPIDYNIVDQDVIGKRYYDLQTFDSDGTYYVPYFYGVVGIMYNKELVDEADLVSWDVLWNAKYSDSIYMYDSVRETLAVGLLHNGFSLNDTNSDHLKIVQTDLIAQKSIIAGYGTDDIKYSIQNGDAAMGVVYSGDYLLLGGEDDNLGFYVPNEGTNVYVDNMVVLEGGRNEEMANRFIAFMNREENAVANAQWVGYSTPNIIANEFLSALDPFYQQEVYQVSDHVFYNSEVYIDLGEDLKLYDTVYSTVKNS